MAVPVRAAGPPQPDPRHVGHRPGPAGGAVKGAVVRLPEAVHPAPLGGSARRQKTEDRRQEVSMRSLTVFGMTGREGGGGRGLRVRLRLRGRERGGGNLKAES
jgi:hypothetical protein